MNTNNQPRKSVLIVDSLQLTIDSMTTTLNDWGYDVDGFTDPLQALAALRKNSYHLVLSELLMPNLDGHKLLYRFNKEKPNQACCLVTCASEEDKLFKKAIRLPNVKSYVKKPIKFEELRLVLEGEPEEQAKAS